MFEVNRPVTGGKTVTPGGAGSGEVQYNKAGVFTGDENFTYSLTPGVSNDLNIGGTLPSSYLNILGATSAITLGGTTNVISAQSGVNLETIEINARNFIFANANGSWSIGGSLVPYNNNLNCSINGGTLALVEGTGTAMQGVVALVAGSATVANVNIKANSRILLTSQADGGAIGFLRISAINAGVGFTITSSSPLDTSSVFYFIMQVGVS